MKIGPCVKPILMKKSCYVNSQPEKSKYSSKPRLPEILRHAEK